MMKLNMIEAYRELAEGENAVFFHPEGQEDQARLIKMRINSAWPVNLWITPVDRIDPETGVVDEEPMFLGHVDPGLEQIEFFYKGTFALSAQGGAIWLDTYDNTAFSVEASDTSSYAIPNERPEIDPVTAQINQMIRERQREFEAQRLRDRYEYEARIRQLEERVTNVSTSAAPASGGTSSGEQALPTGAPSGDPATATTSAAGTGGEPDGTA